jgi:hypothetical protein
MSGDISDTSIIRAASQQISCDLNGEAAILNLESGIYYGLNEVGARVWALIRDPKPVGEIRNVLLKEFDVQPDRCEHDLLEILASLAEAGLIKIENASG